QPEIFGGTGAALLHAGRPGASRLGGSHQSAARRFQVRRLHQSRAGILMTAPSILRWLGWGLAFLVVLLSTLFGFVQLGPGKALLAHSVAMLASGDDFKIKVSGITGFVPADMAIEQIVIGDADGPYAEIA